MASADATLKFLIADDHPLYRAALATTLGVEFAQADILESEDLGSSITTLAERGNVDLLLLDLNMPGADGFNGLASIRKQFPAVPVVVISGSDQSKVVRQAAQFGASGFLSKTAKPAEICQCIDSVLAGDEWFSEEALAEEPESNLPELMEQLTPQQLRIFQMVASGMLNKQIAYELEITEPTVKSHVTSILRKTGLRHRKELIKEAQSLAID